MNVLNFEEREVNILQAEEINECECVYASHAEEFVLSIISVRENIIYNSSSDRSIEILLCTDGKATIVDFGKNDKVVIDRGKSIVIPAAVKKYSIQGNAIFYKAVVPGWV